LVNIKYNGRFGNIMFQYALGRIIAEELGHSMFGDMETLIHKDTISMFNHFDLPKSINGLSCHSVQNENLTGHQIDLQSILTNFTPRNIILDGYFQRAEYYLPHRDKIKQWFVLSDIDFEPNEKDIILHIRRSDFIIVSTPVPLSFYSEILDNGDYDNVYIAGGNQDIDNTVISHFKKYNPIYVDKSAIDTFRMIQKFKNVVQSMSTFCWWSCFLSDNAKCIYTPIPKHGYWSDERPEIDLIINEDKYINIRL
jgi:hypothetical protein